MIRPHISFVLVVVVVATTISFAGALAIPNEWDEKRNATNDEALKEEVKEARPIMSLLLNDIVHHHYRSNLRRSTDSIPKSFSDFAALNNTLARQNAISMLERYAIPSSDANTVRIDSDGQLYYEDHFPTPPTGKERRDEPKEVRNERIRRFITDNPSTGTSSSGVPHYHSKAGSTNVLYLDFDGHVQPSDSAWGAFSAKPFDKDGDDSTFSNSEILDIVEIWKLTSEDFAPFDIDVTTELPDDFQTQTTIHALITSATQTDGSPMPSESAGGVAYVGIFDSSTTPYYSPALNYHDNVADYAPNINLVVAHECGHNFGLSHDGTSTKEYSSKTSGTSEFDSWGPIMGAPYGAAVVVFSNGEYPDSNNDEDDLEILGSQLGSRSDAAGSDSSSASPLVFSDSTQFSAEGVILSRTDTDWWKFTSSSDGLLNVAASPFLGTIDDGGNNLDIELTVYDTDGSTVLATSSPSSRSTAEITDLAIGTGTYYVEVDGVGVSSTITSDYGSIGQYELSGTVSSGHDVTEAPSTDRVFTLYCCANA
eukprot:m.24347 g.24347  ORF g.24347 m.24347 type:complete len:538 (+) comp9104_c0_seq1:107-1720(+)